MTFNVPKKYRRYVVGAVVTLVTLMAVVGFVNRGLLINTYQELLSQAKMSAEDKKAKYDALDANKNKRKEAAKIAAQKVSDYDISQAQSEADKAQKAYEAAKAGADSTNAASMAKLAQAEADAKMAAARAASAKAEKSGLASDQVAASAAQTAAQTAAEKAASFSQNQRGDDIDKATTTYLECSEKMDGEVVLGPGDQNKVCEMKDGQWRFSDTDQKLTIIPTYLSAAAKAGNKVANTKLQSQIDSGDFEGNKTCFTGGAPLANGRIAGDQMCDNGQIKSVAYSPNGLFNAYAGISANDACAADAKQNSSINCADASTVSKYQRDIDAAKASCTKNGQLDAQCLKDRFRISITPSKSESMIAEVEENQTLNAEAKAIVAKLTDESTPNDYRNAIKELEKLLAANPSFIGLKTTIDELKLGLNKDIADAAKGKTDAFVSYLKEVIDNNNQDAPLPQAISDQIRNQCQFLHPSVGCSSTEQVQMVADALQNDPTYASQYFFYTSKNQSEVAKYQNIKTALNACSAILNPTPADKDRCSRVIAGLNSIKPFIDADGKKYTDLKNITEIADSIDTIQKNFATAIPIEPPFSEDLEATTVAVTAPSQHLIPSPAFTKTKAFDPLDCYLQGKDVSYLFSSSMGCANKVAVGKMVLAPGALSNTDTPDAVVCGGTNQPACNTDPNKPSYLHGTYYVNEEPALIECAAGLYNKGGVCSPDYSQYAQSIVADVINSVPVINIPIQAGEYVRAQQAQNRSEQIATKINSLIQTNPLAAKVITDNLDSLCPADSKPQDGACTFSIATGGYTWVDTSNLNTASSLTNLTSQQRAAYLDSTGVSTTEPAKKGDLGQACGASWLSRSDPSACSNSLLSCQGGVLGFGMTCQLNEAGKQTIAAKVASLDLESAATAPTFNAAAIGLNLTTASTFKPVLQSVVTDPNLVRSKCNQKDTVFTQNGGCFICWDGKGTTSSIPSTSCINESTMKMAAAAIPDKACRDQGGSCTNTGGIVATSLGATSLGNELCGGSLACIKYSKSDAIAFKNEHLNNPRIQSQSIMGEMGDICDNQNPCHSSLSCIQGQCIGHIAASFHPEYTNGSLASVIQDQNAGGVIGFIHALPAVGMMLDHVLAPAIKSASPSYWQSANTQASVTRAFVDNYNANLQQSTIYYTNDPSKALSDDDKAAYVSSYKLTLDDFLISNSISEAAKTKVTQQVLDTMIGSGHIQAGFATASYQALATTSIFTSAYTERMSLMFNPNTKYDNTFLEYAREGGKNGTSMMLGVEITMVIGDVVTLGTSETLLTKGAVATKGWGAKLAAEAAGEFVEAGEKLTFKSVAKKTGSVTLNTIGNILNAPRAWAEVPDAAAASIGKSVMSTVAQSGIGRGTGALAQTVGGAIKIAAGGPLSFILAPVGSKAVVSGYTDLFRVFGDATLNGLAKWNPQIAQLVETRLLTEKLIAEFIESGTQESWEKLTIKIAGELDMGSDSTLRKIVEEIKPNPQHLGVDLASHGITPEDLARIAGFMDAGDRAYAITKLLSSKPDISPNAIVGLKAQTDALAFGHQYGLIKNLSDTAEADQFLKVYDAIGQQVATSGKSLTKSEINALIAASIDPANKSLIAFYQSGLNLAFDTSMHPFAQKLGLFGFGEIDNAKVFTARLEAAGFDLNTKLFDEISPLSADGSIGTVTEARPVAVEASPPTPPHYDFSSFDAMLPDDKVSLIRKSDEAAAAVRQAVETSGGTYRPKNAAYRLEIPSSATEELATEMRGFNALLDDFETTVGFHLDEGQVATLLDGHSIIKMEAGGGKTDVIMRVLSAKDGRGLAIMSKDAEALDFINKQVLPGRDFYEKRATSVVFLDAQRGPLRVDLSASVFDVKSGIPVPDAEFSELLVRAQKGEAGILIVTSRAPTGWTYMAGKKVNSFFDRLFGRSSSQSSQAFSKIIEGGYGKFTILADEIGDDITGSLAISGKAIPLGKVTKPKDVMGLRNGKEAIRLHGRLGEIEEVRQLRLTVQSQVAGNTHLNHFMYIGNGQVAPKDAAVHARSLAGVVDSVSGDPSLARALQREQALAAKLGDFSQKLRGVQTEDDLKPLLAEFEDFLSISPSGSNQKEVLTELTFMKQHLQDTWKQLSGVPNTHFGVEGSEVVLFKAGGSTGERLSTVSQLMAFYEETPVLLQKAGIDTSTLKPVDFLSIGISKQEDQISIRKLYELMLQSGHDLRAFDATPDTAAHMLSIAASGESEIITMKPSWFSANSDQTKLIADFHSHAEAGKAQVAVIASEHANYDRTRSALITTKTKDVVVARYSQKTDGETVVEYLAYKLEGGNLVVNEGVKLPTQKAWDDYIHLKLQGDPEELLVLYEGRVRAVDLSVSQDNLKLQWSVFAESGTDVEQITQSIKRNRLLVQRQQEGLLALNITQSDIDLANRYGLYVETDVPLRADTAMDHFYRNHQANLAQIRLDNATRSFGEARKTAIEALRSNLDEIAGTSGVFNFRRNRISSYLDSMDAEAERLRIGFDGELSRTPLTDPDEIASEIYLRGQKADENLRQFFTDLRDQVGLDDNQAQMIAKAWGIDLPFPEKDDFLVTFNSAVSSMVEREGVGPAYETILWAKNNGKQATNPLFEAPETAWLNKTNQPALSTPLEEVGLLVREATPEVPPVLPRSPSLTPRQTQAIRLLTTNNMPALRGLNPDGTVSQVRSWLGFISAIATPTFRTIARLQTAALSGTLDVNTLSQQLSDVGVTDDFSKAVSDLLIQQNTDAIAAASQPEVPQAENTAEVVESRAVVLHESNQSFTFSSADHPASRPIIVGRTTVNSPNQTLMIPNAPVSDHVSREHLSVYHDGNGWVAVDTNSSRGTWINGERVAEETPKSLSSGDVISLAEQVSFRVTISFDGTLTLSYINPLEPATEWDRHVAEFKVWFEKVRKGSWWSQGLLGLNATWYQQTPYGSISRAVQLDVTIQQLYEAKAPRADIEDAVRSRATAKNKALPQQQQLSETDLTKLIAYEMNRLFYKPDADSGFSRIIERARKMVVEITDQVGSQADKLVYQNGDPDARTLYVEQLTTLNAALRVQHVTGMTPLVMPTAIDGYLTEEGDFAEGFEELSEAFSRADFARRFLFLNHVDILHPTDMTQYHQLLAQSQLLYDQSHKQYRFIMPTSQAAKAAVAVALASLAGAVAGLFVKMKKITNRRVVFVTIGVTILLVVGILLARLPAKTPSSSPVISTNTPTATLTVPTAIQTQIPTDTPTDIPPQAPLVEVLPLLSSLDTQDIDIQKGLFPVGDSLMGRLVEALDFVLKGAIQNNVKNGNPQLVYSNGIARYAQDAAHIWSDFRNSVIPPGTVSVIWVGTNDAEGLIDKAPDGIDSIVGHATANGNKAIAISLTYSKVRNPKSIDIINDHYRDLVTQGKLSAFIDLKNKTVTYSDGRVVHFQDDFVDENGVFVDPDGDQLHPSDVNDDEVMRGIGKLVSIVKESLIDPDLIFSEMLLKTPIVREEAAAPLSSADTMPNTFDTAPSMFEKIAERKIGTADLESWMPLSFLPNFYRLAPTAENLQKLADSLNPASEANVRYWDNVKSIGTKCNIFLSDFTLAALGNHGLPHWINGQEMTINDYVAWFNGTLNKNKFGSPPSPQSLGWRLVVGGAEEAQELANQGKVVIGLLQRSGSGHGYVVVPGQTEPGINGGIAPRVAQAGNVNGNDISANETSVSQNLDDVVYYVNDLPGDFTQSVNLYPSVMPVFFGPTLFATWLRDQIFLPLLADPVMRTTIETTLRLWTPAHWRGNFLWLKGEVFPTPKRSPVSVAQLTRATSLIRDLQVDLKDLQQVVASKQLSFLQGMKYGAGRQKIITSLLSHSNFGLDYIHDQVSGLTYINPTLTGEQYQAVVDSLKRAFPRGFKVDPKTHKLMSLYFSNANMVEINGVWHENTRLFRFFDFPRWVGQQLNYRLEAVIGRVTWSSNQWFIERFNSRSWDRAHELSAILEMKLFGLTIPRLTQESFVKLNTAITKVIVNTMIMPNVFSGAAQVFDLAINPQAIYSIIRFGSSFVANGSLTINTIAETWSEAKSGGERFGLLLTGVVGGGGFAFIETILPPVFNQYILFPAEAGLMQAISAIEQSGKSQGVASTALLRYLKAFESGVSLSFSYIGYENFQRNVGLLGSGFKTAPVVNSPIDDPVAIEKPVEVQPVEKEPVVAVPEPIKAEVVPTAVTEDGLTVKILDRPPNVLIVGDSQAARLAYPLLMSLKDDVVFIGSNEVVYGGDQKILHEGHGSFSVQEFVDDLHDGVWNDYFGEDRDLVGEPSAINKNNAPDIVVVEIGTNNAKSGNIAGFASEVREIIAFYRELNPYTQIVLSQIPPNGELWNDNIGLLNQQLKAIAAEDVGVVYAEPSVNIDVIKDIGDGTNGAYEPDPIHINGAGATKIAGGIMEELGPAVELITEPIRAESAAVPDVDIGWNESTSVEEVKAFVVKNQPNTVESFSELPLQQCLTAFIQVVGLGDEGFEHIPNIGSLNIEDNKLNIASRLLTDLQKDKLDRGLATEQLGSEDGNAYRAHPLIIDDAFVPSTPVTAGAFVIYNGENRNDPGHIGIIYEVSPDGESLLVFDSNRDSTEQHVVEWMTKAEFIAQYSHVGNIALVSFDSLSESQQSEVVPDSDATAFVPENLPDRPIISVANWINTSVEACGLASGPTDRYYAHAGGALRQASSTPSIALRINSLTTSQGEVLGASTQTCTATQRWLATFFVIVQKSIASPQVVSMAKTPGVWTAKDKQSYFNSIGTLLDLIRKEIPGINIFAYSSTLLRLLEEDHVLNAAGDIDLEMDPEHYEQFFNFVHDPYIQKLLGIRDITYKNRVNGNSYFTSNNIVFTIQIGDGNTIEVDVWADYTKVFMDKIGIKLTDVRSRPFTYVDAQGNTVNTMIPTFSAEAAQRVYSDFNLPREDRLREVGNNQLIDMGYDLTTLPKEAKDKLLKSLGLYVKDRAKRTQNIEALQALKGHIILNSEVSNPSTETMDGVDQYPAVETSTDDSFRKVFYQAVRIPQNTADWIREAARKIDLGESVKDPSKRWENMRLIQQSTSVELNSTQDPESRVTMEGMSPEDYQRASITNDPELLSDGEILNPTILVANWIENAKACGEASVPMPTMIAYSSTPSTPLRINSLTTSTGEVLGASTTKCSLAQVVAASGERIVQAAGEALAAVTDGTSAAALNELIRGSLEPRNYIEQNKLLPKPLPREYQELTINEPHYVWHDGRWSSRIQNTYSNTDSAYAELWFIGANQPTKLYHVTSGQMEVYTIPSQLSLVRASVDSTSIALGDTPAALRSSVPKEIQIAQLHDALGDLKLGTHYKEEIDSAIQIERGSGVKDESSSFMVNSKNIFFYWRNGVGQAGWEEAPFNVVSGRYEVNLNEGSYMYVPKTNILRYFAVDDVSRGAITTTSNVRGNAPAQVMVRTYNLNAISQLRPSSEALYSIDPSFVKMANAFETAYTFMVNYIDQFIFRPINSFFHPVVGTIPGYDKVQVYNLYQTYLSRQELTFNAGLYYLLEKITPDQLEVILNYIYRDQLSVVRHYLNQLQLSLFEGFRHSNLLSIFLGYYQSPELFQFLGRPESLSGSRYGQFSDPSFQSGFQTFQAIDHTFNLPVMIIRLPEDIPGIESKDLFMKFLIAQRLATDHLTVDEQEYVILSKPDVVIGDLLQLYSYVVSRPVLAQSLTRNVALSSPIPSLEVFQAFQNYLLDSKDQQDIQTFDFFKIPQAQSSWFVVDSSGRHSLILDESADDGSVIVNDFSPADFLTQTTSAVSQFNTMYGALGEQQGYDELFTLDDLTMRRYSSLFLAVKKLGYGDNEKLSVTELVKVYYLATQYFHNPQSFNVSVDVNSVGGVNQMPDGFTFRLSGSQEKYTFSIDQNKTKPFLDDDK